MHPTYLNRVIAPMMILLRSNPITGVVGCDSYIRLTFRQMPPRSGYAMTTIPDAQLYAHNERLQGKVVLITGKRDAPWCALSCSSPSSLYRWCGRYWERNRPAVCKVKVRLFVSVQLECSS